MKNASIVISNIENINNLSSRGMTEEVFNERLYSRFFTAMTIAEQINLEIHAISYYNFKYLHDLHGDLASTFYLQWKDTIGTKEKSDELIKMSKETIVDIINKQPAWGSKQILTLPYGEMLSTEMKKMSKSSLGTKDIIYLLFGIKAKEVGFIYYDEFVNMMKQQKTMVSKKTAQTLLKTFWENTRDDYKSNPDLFNLIKSIIINLNSNLKESNSTQQLRIQFMEQFINLVFN